MWYIDGEILSHEDILRPLERSVQLRFVKQSLKNKRIHDFKSFDSENVKVDPDILSYSI